MTDTEQIQTAAFPKMLVTLYKTARYHNRETQHKILRLPPNPQKSVHFVEHNASEINKGWIG